MTDKSNVKLTRKSTSLRIFAVAAVFFATLLVFAAPAGAVDTWDGKTISDSLSGNGTSANDPYQISSGADLAFLASKVNEGVATYNTAYYKLTEDIDLGNNEWKPIGQYADETSKNPFKGTFDGGGKTISNLNVTGEMKCAGLFGYVDGGTISNLHLSGDVNNTKEYTQGEEDTHSYAGGLVGYLISGGKIENICASMKVAGNSDVGGIVGRSDTYSNKAEISGCTFIGEVCISDNGKSYSNAGGIAGSLNNVQLSNCQVFADIEGTYSVGGIVGGISNSEISYCISTGKVNEFGTGFAGGCVGSSGTNNNDNSKISNCIVLNENIMANSGSFVVTSKSVFGNSFTTTITISDCKLWTGMALTAPPTEEEGDSSGFDEVYAAEFWKNTNFWESFTKDSSVWVFDTENFPIPTLKGHDKPESGNDYYPDYLEPKYSVNYVTSGNGITVDEENVPKTKFDKYAAGESVSIADPSPVLVAGYPATQWSVKIKSLKNNMPEEEDSDEEEDSEEEGEEDSEEEGEEEVEESNHNIIEEEDRIYNSYSNPIFIVDDNTFKRKGEGVDKDIIVYENIITFHPEWVGKVYFKYACECEDTVEKSIGMYAMGLDEVPSSCCDPTGGFTFAGWGTANGDDEESKKAETLVVNTDGTLQRGVFPYTNADGEWIHGNEVTFYQFFAANKYTLAFDANGGVGSMDNMDCEYSTENKITLPINNFTRDDYQFAGWAKSKDAAKAEFNNCDEIPHFAVSSDDAKVTLYAVWHENPTSEEDKDKENEDDKKDENDNESEVITPSNPQDKPSTNTGTGSSSAILISGGHGSSVGSATYSITFDANGGSGTMNQLSVENGKTAPLTKNTFTREGYIFAGWALSANGEVAYKDGEEIKPERSMTLYAFWVEEIGEPADIPEETEQTGVPLWAFAAGGVVLILAILAAVFIVRRK